MSPQLDLDRVELFGPLQLRWAEKIDQSHAQQPGGVALDPTSNVLLVLATG